MFKTLLLATVARAGAAHVPAPASDLIARNKYSQSHPLLNSQQEALWQQGQAVDNGVLLFAAQAETKVIATITKPAEIVTSTISCAAPTTALVINDEPTDGKNETLKPEGNAKREANAPK
ncbi:hypothetical protein CERZMDRAFT_95887 [Cercospora zeae-maydis SCOH1-5]|uniref:Uncharacterized protein n=1 Tax=Cercospora zeae-maydis SCOH1-5 TaxID=717836 RepID=A0A6A6FK91_9PEZI|nr:hypothetical protein CERZMDRAFT_95887 [Cercospora zeae-maydis SCOH1-5]